MQGTDCIVFTNQKVNYENQIDYLVNGTAIDLIERIFWLTEHDWLIAH